MIRVSLAAVLLALGGCESVGYLDPSGPGEARTVGGLCPYPYRVLDIPVSNSDARIYVNAFRANEIARELTIFLVVSDSPVFGYQLARSYAPVQKHPHTVSFPDGMAVQVTPDDGTSVSGTLMSVSDGQGGANAVILRFPVPGHEVTQLSVAFPTIVVDGQRVAIGRVNFKAATATIYGINC